MIVVLDTNALYGDRYLRRTQILSLFATAASGRCEVWVPSVVVEELVRQFPEKLAELAAGLGGLRREAEAFGHELPRFPDVASETAGYRVRLEQALQKDGVSIAPPPSGAGRIAEWVAARRLPIPGDGEGTVDAQIWLTVIDAALADEEVVLISANVADFADRDDKTVLHPVLLADLDRFGADREGVELQPRIVDFLALHAEPDEQATGRAESMLAHPQRRSELFGRIEDAVEWFPLSAEDGEWDFTFEVDVERAILRAFDIAGVRLIRAEAGLTGTNISLEAQGEATIDLVLPTSEAAALSDGTTISIEDWELNESMAQGYATGPARLLLEVLLDRDGPAVSIDDLRPVGEEDVLGLLRHWQRQDSDAALDIVAGEFDLPGEQEAKRVWPVAVKKRVFVGAELLARVEFGVEYANPVDSDDGELSARNTTEVTIDLAIEKPNFEQLECGAVDLAREGALD